jgi:hypothetical protein
MPQSRRDPDEETRLLAADPKTLSDDERLARRRAQARERARRRRERERALVAVSLEERERLRAKWRAQAAKAYAREKEGREVSPEEREKFRAKWRARRKKAAEREVAGRSFDAPEALRELAAKRKEYRRLHQARKYAGDLNHKLSVVLRSRLTSAVRNGQKRGSAIRDLGCTVDELKAHLEGLFTSGMTWDNFGHGEGRWNIDHVFPIKRADLTDRAHVLAVCNWRNLRPEWFVDNVRKSARVTPEARAFFDEMVAQFRLLEDATSGRTGRASKSAPRGS